MNETGSILKGYIPILVLFALCCLNIPAYAEFSRLQAVGNCINQSELARAIQEGRQAERDDLATFLGRLAIWPNDPEVQSKESPGDPPPQGMIDYIEGIGVYVFNTFDFMVTGRNVQRVTYENCRLAWIDHFNNGAPAPVFYDFPIGISEPVNE